MDGTKNENDRGFDTISELLLLLYEDKKYFNNVDNGSKRDDEKEFKIILDSVPFVIRDDDDGVHERVTNSYHNERILYASITKI